MKENKNRIIVALIALVVVMGTIFFVNSNKGNDFDKTIHLEIVDDQGNVVLNEPMGTNAGTLAEALKEWDEKEYIELEYEDSEYGMFITGLGKTEAIEQNESKGLYWMYTSENNKACVADGFCTGADSLEIADEDSFVFTLSMMQ